MYANTNGTRHDPPPHEHGGQNRGTNAPPTSVRRSQKRQPQLSRPQLVREFELLMLTALVETARRDRAE